MLFNSLQFALFLPAVVVGYWLLRRKPPRYQNLLLLAASYLFYAWWDWRFLGLIIIVSLSDYLVGRGLAVEERPGRRRLLLGVSLVVNLGILGFFKYFNFFADSAADLLRLFGLKADPTTLNIILPLGISFFTFKSLSYSIDVFRKKCEPTRDAVAYFAYVAFFPQLFAGPIERAKNLLPQFLKPRTFDADEAKDGLRQILWGLVKKIAVADFLAVYVDAVFLTYNHQDGLVLGIGIFLYAIQLYADFSGYSDIAIGVGKLLGFKTNPNFACPYFSRNITEFWRRWHISMMSWFRDYIFYPLGGPFKGKARWILYTLVTFAVSGLWHGADWTFVAWGLLNGLYFIPMILKKEPPTFTGVVAKKRLLPSLKETGQMVGTFLLVLLGWVFFRADSLGQAFGYLTRMVTHPLMLGQVWYTYYVMPVLVSLGLLAVEWVQRRKPHALKIEKLPGWVRWSIYYALVVGVLCFGTFGGSEFIYFQF
ncbi:MAG: MBOAT family protein [bacterium]|nr:MBOAT family protein [bacterium]